MDIILFNITLLIITLITLLIIESKEKNYHWDLRSDCGFGIKDCLVVQLQILNYWMSIYYW